MGKNQKSAENANKDGLNRRDFMRHAAAVVASRAVPLRPLLINVVAQAAVVTMEANEVGFIPGVGRALFHCVV